MPEHNFAADQVYGYYIETAWPSVQPRDCKVHRRSAPQLADFGWGNRCFGRAIRRAGAVPHLHKHNGVSVDCDDVYFTKFFVSPIVFDDLPAMPLKKLRCDLFSPATYIGCSSHRRKQLMSVVVLIFAPI